MHPFRTTLAGDIVTEFFPPYLGEKETKQNRAIIFCDGLPGMPGNTRTMMHLSKKGFWTFFPRYRGTWESGGAFLAEEPTRDILDVADAITTPFTSAWEGKEFCVDAPEIFVIGVSFGGPAALFCSRDPRVKKVVSLSGVVDWPACEPYEPMDWLAGVVTQGYGHAYRFDRARWDALGRGEFYNPVSEVDTFSADNILMIHSQDDDVVPVEPTRTFATRVGCRLIELKKGKHVTTSALRGWVLSRRVLRFFNT